RRCYQGGGGVPAERPRCREWEDGSAAAAPGEVKPMSRADAFGARAALPGVEGIDFYRLERLHDQGVGDPSRLPVTVRILLENLLRHGAERYVDDGDVEALARWDGAAAGGSAEKDNGGNAGVRPHSSGEGWRGGAPPTGRVSAQKDKERAYMPARV